MVGTKVRTRSQVKEDESTSDSNEIQAVTRRLSDRRTNPLAKPRSPSKTSTLKHKMKSKRESEKFIKMLQNAKQNLSKAADRAIPNRPVPPKSLFDKIHDPILSGEAKRNLRPVVIVIDDDDSSDD